MEPVIMKKTCSILHHFRGIFLFANLLILSVILATILSYALEWIFDMRLSILLLFGVFLVINFVIIPLVSVFLCCPCQLHCPQFINFPSLYAGRGEANKCLDLLRQESLKDPMKKSYSVTLGSCTAILRLGPNVDNATNAAAEQSIDGLAQLVATPYFVGTTYSASGRGHPEGLSYHETCYISVHCRHSWDGIAEWIAKRQLGNITQEELVPSDTTPLL
ncbi:MAG: hypothetical protein BYD32DRAFT_416335 [Podila humilis]|nr:MAG: hypothetical protein BYD32DRAFT_416335 [Podila humilis]